MMTSTMTKIYVDVIQQSTHCPSFFALFILFPIFFSSPSLLFFLDMSMDVKEKHSRKKEKQLSLIKLQYQEDTSSGTRARENESMTDVSMTYRIKRKEKFKISTASVSFILCQLDDIYVLLISYLFHDFYATCGEYKSSFVLHKSHTKGLFAANNEKPAKPQLAQRQFGFIVFFLGRGGR